MLVDETIAIAAPAGRVWRALVVPEARAAWWGYLTLDAMVGGRFEERWTGDDGQEMLTAGTVTELIPQRLLALDWADSDWPATTRVEIRLAESGDGATTVRVLHSGWEALPDGAALADAHRAGWRAHLTNLRRVAQHQDGDVVAGRLGGEAEHR